MTPREYLKTLLRTAEEIAAFTDPEVHDDPVANNAGWTFSAGLGWVLKDGVRHDGLDVRAPGSRQRSRTFYHYETDGARWMINGVDEPCRIHTYGDSFTHCDQVSDGETWQEYLAAHLREPIANYGVGGYGVYQAYLRMLIVEAATPAPFIIFNIFQDDHYRSLDAWRSIRFGKKTPCGYTLPHLRVNLEHNTVEPRPNICGSAEDLMKLTDLDWVEKTFADDPVLQMVLATRSGAAGKDTWVPMGFGLTQAAADDDAIARLKDSHTQAALRSTRWILDCLEAFAEMHDKKILIVLSYGPNGIRPVLESEPRFDQLVLDHLAAKPFPVVDLRDAHAADYFGGFSADVDAYLKRFYIGHYSPVGNFFEAQAILPALIEMLDPKPKPYLT